MKSFNMILVALLQFYYITNQCIKKDDKMASEFKVGCSPLTDTLYAGKVNDKGMYTGVKHDVTDSAVSAVAQLLVQTDTCLEFTMKGKNYVLKVEESKNGN